jgi:hypothetical protein
MAPNDMSQTTLERAVDVLTLPDTGLAYSFCTLVSDRAEYGRMIASFQGSGFSTADCEYLYVDNSRGNQLEAFAAYNLFLTLARGRHIILCHQDILPAGDDRAKLDRRLAELNDRDPAWALCGNAGRTAEGGYVIRISDPTGHDIGREHAFPMKVMSLDENFIVARRSANLAVSRDLAGFHWYGADLSVVADILGYTAYVIDFHLIHRSGGNPDATFHQLRSAFIDKYARAFRPRWHYTTVSSVFLSASRVRSLAHRAIAHLRRHVYEWVPRRGA